MYDQLLRDPGIPVPNPTQSYWQIPPNKVLEELPSTNCPTHSDIVIIGSGITGCSIARELLVNGYSGRVTILEARGVCSGATGRNGGRINCTAVHDYAEYRARFGDEAARSIVEFELAHLHEITAVARELGAEAFARSEVRDVDTFAAVFTQEKYLELTRWLAEFEAAFPQYRGRWRMVGAEAETVYGMKGAKGALVGRAGAAWPYRFITAVYEMLLDRFPGRFSIHAHTPVLGVARRPSHESSADQSLPYVVDIGSDRVVSAKHVVYACEGHVAHLLPSLRGILLPRLGQMSVQRPGLNYKSTGGRASWSFYFNHGFDYACENPHTSEIFIGGGELGGLDSALDMHAVADDSRDNIAAKSHLIGVLPAVYGEENWGAQRDGEAQARASWTGVMCASLDGCPMVGMIPPNILGEREVGSLERGAEWMSTGYGGYGMVNAWRSGRATAAQILGRGVPEWLPKQYQITAERMDTLKKKLDSLKGTEAHLRAFMH